MKVLALFLISSLLLFNSCELIQSEALDAECIIPATIRDITGLDGCSFVLELNSGERLIPLMQTSSSQAQHITIKVNGTYHSFSEGQKVLINYVEENRPNICMAGQSVIISCIKQLESE